MTLNYPLITPNYPLISNNSQMHLNQYVFSILDDIAKDCFACPSIVSFANYPLMTLEIALNYLLITVNYPLITHMHG